MSTASRRAYGGRDSLGGDRTGNVVAKLYVGLDRLLLLLERAHAVLSRPYLRPRISAAALAGNFRLSGCDAELLDVLEDGIQGVGTSA